MYFFLNYNTPINILFNSLNELGIPLQFFIMILFLRGKIAGKFLTEENIF